MIQDITPHMFDNQYHPVPPGEESYLLCFQERKVLLGRKDGNIIFPRFKDMDADNEKLFENYHYLFTIDKQRYYLVNNAVSTVGSGFSMEHVEAFRNASPQYLAFAGITAFQLYNWYENRKFCGKCGRPLRHDTKERMMYCESCKLREYPKISPAVIVGITHNDRLLLSQYAGSTHNRYALIAGFTEIGETIEETVHREVMEEVGLKVKNLEYYKTQPWSFSDTLLFGFYAQLDGEETITLDTEELSLAKWFHREEIPDCESSDSLTNEMIMKFKYGK